MKNIVHIQKNDLVVSIKDMSKFSGTDERSIENLLRTHIERFERMGLVVKEKGKYRDFKSQLLNEPQATFLITLMRNTKKVADFKEALVMEFYRMREMLCEVNRVQLEAAQREIKQLQVRNMKTYSHGFISLRKYLKDNDIALTEETAWSMLLAYGVVENRDVLVSKKFLKDETFGRQNGDAAIEFNSRALDEVFGELVDRAPTLF